MVGKSRGLSALAALTVGLSLIPAGAQAAFTIDQILSAPIASSLKAAPHGSRAAWVLNEGGRRNIYLAEAPTWEARKVTAFDNDDGQDIGELSWAPGGTAILFTRGGDFEFGGVVPNSAALPERPIQAIWIARLDGSAPEKLAEGHLPTPSPGGDEIAFVSKGQLRLLSLGNHAARTAVDATGTITEVRWAPDSQSIAFVNRRGDHSFIAVYRLKPGTLSYLDASVDQDASPVWSSDGRHIAFLRIPTGSEGFGPKRAGEPFSIRIADVATGAGRELWKADNGPGSIFQKVVADAQLFWMKNGYLIFPWERDGWIHLYRIDVAGGPPSLLTPGDGEVENVIETNDQAKLFYSSNQGDLDRRHIWQMNADGAVTRLTRDAEIETSPAPIEGNSAHIYLGSDATHPLQAMIRLADGAARGLVPEATPPSFPAAELVTPQPVTILAADGLALHGQLFLPPNSPAAARHPALVFVHGGSRRQMLLGFHYMDVYSSAYAMNEYFASRGYIVLSINFRSGTGYGLNFREPTDYGATGASEFADVIGAGLYLRNRPDVDGKRIGLWGKSYGGYLTALGLARASDLFAAGVDINGVHDWSEMYRGTPPAYDANGHYATAMRVAFESSPVASMSTWRSPVLLIHGDDDRNVSFDQTVELVKALRAHGVDFEQIIFPNEIHNFLLFRHWVETYQAMAEFLDRKLGVAAADGVKP